MKPRNEKHEPTAPQVRREQPKLWFRIVKLFGMALALAVLALPLTPLAADPPTATRWHVVVSTAPHLPQDVRLSGMGNNTDGWTSGGSMVLNQLAQGFPNGAQATLLLDIVEGGIVGKDGTPVAPGTYTFPGIELPAFDYDVTTGTVVLCDPGRVCRAVETPRFPAG